MKTMQVQALIASLLTFNNPADALFSLLVKFNLSHDNY